jgi:hypothetical protein
MLSPIPSANKVAGSGTGVKKKSSNETAAGAVPLPLIS